MSEGVYYIQYTGTGVVELGDAGVFQAQTAAFVSAEVAELARKHGDFIVEEREPPAMGPAPKAESEAAEAAASATESPKSEPAPAAASESKPKPAEKPAAEGKKDEAKGAAKDEKKDEASGKKDETPAKK